MKPPPLRKPKKIAWWISRGLLAFMGIGAIAGIAQSFAGTANSTPPTETATSAPTATITFTAFPTFTALPSFTPTDKSTATLTFTPLPTFTPTVTLPAVDAAACVPADSPRQVGRVTKITDGDTIHVEIDGVDYSVRYIGIDAPEVGKTGAAQATTLNTNLVQGQTVTLVRDVSETDSFGRLLRYVFAGKVFVNYQLVAKGVAVAGSWPPDTSCDETFNQAQINARMNQLGLWVPTAIPPTAVIATKAPSTPLPLLSYPTNTPVIDQGSNCDPAYPTVCIPSPPPDLNCKDIPYRRFKVLPPDPHHFDGDNDGIGCES